MSASFLAARHLPSRLTLLSLPFRTLLPLLLNLLTLGIHLLTPSLLLLACLLHHLAAIRTRLTLLRLRLLLSLPLRRVRRSIPILRKSR